MGNGKEVAGNGFWVSVVDSLICLFVDLTLDP